MVQQRKKLLIVGSGASGLPSIRHALLHDVDVTCFEGSNEIGGLWNYKPHETELSSVMKSTVINTSKEMTAYSDFPPEPTMANFMHNTEMFRYLKTYATTYKLRDVIKFNHKVLGIARNDDYKETGRWKVDYTDDKGVKQSSVFDGVLLCSGHHTIPYFPEPFPGQEKYKGKIIHSHSYKDHSGYEDKVVAVVGIGNSGGDIAVELSRISKQAYLVTRRGAWVFNRIFEYGEPVDLAMAKKFMFDMRAYVPEQFACWMVERKLNHRFDHERYGLKPKHRIFGAHPTVNDELPNRIASGTLIIKPNITRFTETGLVFEDGTQVENIDEVIMSTGYSFEFGLVENGELIPVADNEVALYKNVFPMETSDHNTLAVIGLVQPYGSIMPLAEMQSRVFIESFTGNVQLPSPTEMKADIARRRNELKARYVNSRRHTIQVDYIPYIEELAALIGCNVDMKKLILSDPLLAFQVYFGPRVPYVYRLFGPSSWSGARQAIMETDYRARMPTAKHGYKAPIPRNMQNLLAVFIGFIAVCTILFRIFK